MLFNPFLVVKYAHCLHNFMLLMTHFYFVTSFGLLILELVSITSAGKF